MAVMTTGQRRDSWQELMSEWSRERKSIPVTKDILLEGVDAIDQWISDMAGSFNSALPLVLRTALTKAQKTELFIFVLRRRYGLDT
jgi:hypothetical protein